MKNFVKITLAAAMLIAGTSAFAANNDGTSQGKNDRGGVTNLQDPNVDNVGTPQIGTDTMSTGSINSIDKRTQDSIDRCGADQVDINGNCMYQNNQN